MQTELAGLCARYSDLKSSVDQRLKWAVGANPGLKEVVEGLSCPMAMDSRSSRSISLSMLCWGQKKDPNNCMLKSNFTQYT